MTHLFKIPLSTFLFFSLPLLALLILLINPAHSKTFAPDNTPQQGIILTPETLDGLRMQNAWKVLSKHSPEQLTGWIDAPDTMPPNVQIALGTTLNWAERVNNKTINAQNPYNTNNRYFSDNIICSAAKDWLTHNKAQTTALWLHLENTNEITPNMVLTAGNIVAMATAPVGIKSAEEFSSYADENAFINYLELPHLLPSCDTSRGSSTFNMLATMSIPQKALVDIHKTLARQALEGDVHAMKHLAWLASLYYTLSADHI